MLTAIGVRPTPESLTCSRLIRIGPKILQNLCHIPRIPEDYLRQIKVNKISLALGVPKIDLSIDKYDLAPNGENYDQQQNY